MKYLRIFEVFLLCLIIPRIVFANVPDITPLYDAVTLKNWGLVVAIGLTLVVWIIRNISLDTIPKKYLPIITLVFSILPTVSARMVQCITADTSIWKGVIQGIIEGATIGLTAMGIWSSGLKKFPIQQRFQKGLIKRK